MKKYFSKVTSMLLAMFVAFGMMIGSTGAAFASSSWTVYPVEKYGYVGQPGYGVQVIKFGSKEPKYAKIKSVKSSDPKVLKVHKEKYDGETSYWLEYRKAGKAKVTIKYKLPSGKVKTAKKTITVKPYPNQIKGLKVNGKAVSTKKHPFYFDKKYKGTNAKVKIELNEGWKINRAYIIASNDKTYKEIKGAKAKIKNGKAISFPKKYKNLSIDIWMINKNGEEISYGIWLNR